MQNVSEETVHVTPRLYVNGAAHALAPIRLGSDQVYKLELGRELRNLGLSGVTVGGIELAYEGPSEALIAHGALFNGRGFSAEITFLRRAAGPEEHPFSVRTPRVAIGPADPRLGLPTSASFEPLLALANLGESSLPVQLTVGFQAGDGNQEVKLPVVLEPREARVIRLADELQGLLPAETHWASLEVSYASTEAQLAAGVTSVSRDGQHSIAAVLNHVEGSVAEGWYWQVGGDSTTILGILNADTEEATVQIWLDYTSDGQPHRYDLPETVIPGRGTALIDLSEFVGSGQPDADGDVIPLGVAFGGYRVRKVAGGPNRRLTTEALIVNRRTKTLLPLYNTCCGYSDVQVEPDQINGNVGSQHLIALFATNTCSWVEEAIWAEFSSSNSTVASVESFDGIGRVTLNNPGTATITGSAFVEFAQPGCDPGMQPGFDGGGGFGGDTIVCCGCTTAPRSDSASVTAKPTVQFTGGNSFIFVGADSTVKAFNLQQAQGNPSGGTYSWSAAPANRVSSFENLSPPGLVRLTGNAPSTALLDTTLTVNYSLNGQNADPANKSLTVRIFKFLQQSGQVQVIPINGPDVFGYDATVFYNIFTNPGGQQVQPGFGGITVVEVVNTVSITINGEPADIPIDLTTSSGATTANSQIVDQLRLLSNQPLPQGLDVTSTQDLGVGGIFVRNNTLHFLTTTVTITNNGPFN